MLWHFLLLCFSKNNEKKVGIINQKKGWKERNWSHYEKKKKPFPIISKFTKQCCSKWTCQQRGLCSLLSSHKKKELLFPIEHQETGTDSCHFILKIISNKFRFWIFVAKNNEIKRRNLTAKELWKTKLDWRKKNCNPLLTSNRFAETIRASEGKVPCLDEQPRSHACLK